MYQMNDMEMLREHHRALLREAEGERLARRLKGIRPKKEESHAGRMRRRVAVLLSTIGLALLLAASAAHALDIQCPPSIGDAACIGTDGLDTIFGFGGNDTVRAVEGQSDVIDCGPGRDRVEFDAGLDSVKRYEIKEPL